MKPIGIIHFDLWYVTKLRPYMAGGNVSVIELYPNNNFDQALKDLDGFERIWVLYQFHLNSNWVPAGQSATPYEEEREYSHPRRTL